jgi:hypothetical protein
MSALPPKADIAQHAGNIRFVPKADVGAGNIVAGLLGLSLSSTRFLSPMGYGKVHESRKINIGTLAIKFQTHPTHAVGETLICLKHSPVHLTELRKNLRFPKSSRDDRCDGTPMAVLRCDKIGDLLHGKLEEYRRFARKSLEMARPPSSNVYPGSSPTCESQNREVAAANVRFWHETDIGIVDRI